MDLELRARAARARLALAVFVYNPLQPRGPDGRWVKAGGGASSPPTPATPKAPRQRAAKKAAPRASARTWIDESNSGKNISAATERQVEQMFAFKDPETGMSAEVYGVETLAGGGVQAHVNIKNAEGQTVGRAVRTLRKDKDGNPQIYHTSFNLGKRAQGNGFSSRWLRQMEDRYRDAGIDSIALTTTDVGGYAWAKAGFDFADRKEAKVAASALKKLLKSKSVRDQLSQRTITDGQELIRRAETGGEDWPTPAEFAMLGWMPGLETWVGKNAMLGTGWHGKKEL